MVAYNTDQDLYDEFGRTNIEAWADLNNTEDAGIIAARAAKMRKYADEEINGRLRTKGYTIPFADIAANPATPTTINEMSTLLTGIKLYQGRGVTDNEEQNNEVAPQQKRYNGLLSGILNGKIILDAEQAGERGSAAPGVYREDNANTTEAHVNCRFPFT